MGCMLLPSILSGMNCYPYSAAPYGNFPQIMGDKNEKVSWRPDINASKLTIRAHNEPSAVAMVPIDGNSIASIASVIKHYGEVRDLASGRYLHTQLAVNQIDDDRFVGNCLIQMYGGCGSIEDAKSMFDDMHNVNLHSWNILINAYVKNGLCQEAIELHHCMQEEFQSDQVTFVSVLNACVATESLEEGRLVHAAVISNGHYDDVVIRTALVNFYGKCGSLEDATVVFEGISYQNIIFCNAMMTAYTHNGQAEEALRLFHKMKNHDLLPNQATFLCTLDACATYQVIRVGHDIHCSVIECGLNRDVVIGSSLINMYSNCGSLEDSKLAFNGLCEQNTVTWSAIIAACVHCGDDKEGLNVFHAMEHEGQKLNRITLVSAIDACAGLANLEEGWKLHALLVLDGDEADIVAGTSLVYMYGECGSLVEAKDVFDEMRQRNIITWSAMIGAYAHNGSCTKALDIFNQLHVEGFTPNSVTFVSALDACVGMEFLTEGHKIHAAVVVCGYETDVVIATALISMYGKCGRLHDVRSVWSLMLYPNAIPFNAMIAVHTNNGQAKEALTFFHCIYATEIEPNLATFICALDACASLAFFEEGQKIHSAILDSKFASEIALGNALIVMYGKCGSIDDAKNVFSEMLERDVVSWSSLIATCVHNATCKEALDFFNQMQHSHFAPNHVTIVSALDACAGLEALDEGWKIHASVVENGYESKIAVGNALVNLYGKCGDLCNAKIMFERLPEHDLISWNTIIAISAQNGQDADALLYFNQMLLDGAGPDDVTFLSVLSACRHSGRVDDAQHYISSLKVDGGLVYTLEHYVRMVDLLGRVGHLDDAEDLINNMPFEPNSTIWSCLLTCCKLYGDVDRAVRAANHAVALEPSNIEPYITLANIYAAANMWDDARKLQESKGIVQPNVQPELKTSSLHLLPALPPPPPPPCKTKSCSKST